MASPKEKLNRQFVKAAGKGDLGRMERLLAEGAEIDALVDTSWLGGTKRTALQQAALDSESESIKFLISRGASRNLVDGEGSTPLMYAVASGYCGAVETLLQSGVRPDIKNNDGKTALDISIKTENTCATDEIRKALAELQAIESRRLAQERARRAEAMRPPVKTEPPKPVQVQPAPPKPEPKKENPDIVIFRQQAGDRTLEDVFNFVSLERVTLIRKGIDGPVEAMHLQGFSQVESRSFLKRAIAEHQRRGGKVTESDIFPDTKAKVLKQPGAEP